MNDRTYEDKSLVTIIGGKPFTTTIIIAHGVGNQHKNVMAMVRQYQADLEEFGQLAFETRVVSAHGAGQATEYAILNERQSGLLLSFMRNTEVIKEFKKALIRAFFALADQVQRLSAQAETKPPINVSIVSGNVDQKDRPVAVSTKVGTAYFNWATYFLFSDARSNPYGPEAMLMSGAMAVSKEMIRNLPAPIRTIQKLKKAMLDANPLWSDILRLHCMGLTTATIARSCGCHPSTVRRHLKKMEEAGIFDDPFKELSSDMQDMLTPPRIEG